MAANLIKPEHFARPRRTENSVLIPPSAFENPPAVKCQNVDWERVLKEIELLKSENNNLKALQTVQPFVQPSSQPVYADELIKRQACEIVELKSELLQCRQLHEQELISWEKELKLLENKSQEEITQVQKQSQRREESFEQSIDRLSRDLQTTFEENSTLKEKFESDRNNFEAKIKDIAQELNSVKRDGDIKIQELEIENRKKAVALEESSTLIAQLKCYIGQSEESNKPALAWKTEKETVENQLKIQRAENEKTKSHLELLEVRFKALNDIMVIQEGELSKKKGEDKQKQRGFLLTRWREKVFTLLVQQKSSDIVHKNELNKARDQITSLEDSIQSYKAEQEMIKHCLTEKAAQLQIEVQQKEQLIQELSQTQEVAVCLDDQNRDQGNAIKALAEFAQSTEEKYQSTMQKLEEKLSQFKALCQRVSFASSRMDLFKTQLLRKAALSSSTAVDIGNNAKKSTSQSMSRSRADDDMSRDSEEYLYQEMERLMKERDSLATQVRTDSTKYSQIMTETRSIYQTEISTLKKTVEDLETDIQQKSRKYTKLTEELTTLKEETQEYQDTIAQLQAELAKHVRGVEGVLTDQRLKDDEIYSEKIADLTRQLNDSKREHAKTVVTLRQLERSHAREAERGKDLLGSTEQHLNYQVQQLQTRLLNMEKENNTMKATLRQEGLLSKLKSDRGEPVWFPLDKVSEGNQDKEMQAEREADHERVLESDIVSTRGSTEPVENVLQDLKSLSAVILNEDLSEDENEDDS